MDLEQLKREFESIEKTFADLRGQKLLPLRIEWGTKEAFEEEMDKIKALKDVRANLTKAILISLCRRVEAQGDWWAYWLGRSEAYLEIEALLKSDKLAYLCHTIVSENNLKLVKEKGLI